MLHSVSSATGTIIVILLLRSVGLAACTSPAGIEGQVKWISPELKFCNGSTWDSLSVRTLSATCSATAKIENTAYDYRYCNGANWVSMLGPQTRSSCSASELGQTRSRFFSMEYCDGTDWRVAKTVAPTSCPSGFVLVPALAPYTYSSFCVAKYEMKAVGVASPSTYDPTWTPVSQAADQPIRSITHSQAVASCKKLGNGYDLISNDQWQTLARNIEGVGWNWQTGAVGGTMISQGHVDNAHIYSSPRLPASADTDPCYLTGQTCSDSTWHVQRRTHRLSNGEYIWDLGGNVEEWVKGGIDLTPLSGTTNFYVSAITNAAYPTTDGQGRTLKDLVGPAGDYTSLNSGYYGGLGRVDPGPGGEKFWVRGSPYSDGQATTLGKPGIFRVRSEPDDNVTITDRRGFRCVFAGSCQALDHASTPARANLVGYWKLDETSGAASISDSAGSSTGTLVSSPTTGISGRLGNGISVTAGSHVTVGNAAAIKPTFPLSVAAWVKLNSLGAVQTIYSNDSSVNYRGIMIQVSAANKLQLQIGNGAGSGASDRVTFTSVRALTTGVWYHVVGVATAYNNMKIYINGVDDTAAGFSGTATSMVYGTSVGKIGSRDIYHFDGTIDDVAIWNTGLTETQVRSLYNQQSCAQDVSSRSTGALVSWWKFDEASYSGAAGEAVDSKGVQGGAAVGGATTVADARSGRSLNVRRNSDVTTGQWVNVPDNTSLDVATSDFSYGGWVKLVGGDNKSAVIMSNSSNSNSVGFTLETSSNGFARLRLIWGASSATITGNNSIDDGRWHHLIATVARSGTIYLYVDGVSADSELATNSGVSLTNTDPLRLGGRPHATTPNSINGQLDDIAIWNRALTPAEVYEVYQNQPY